MCTAGTSLPSLAAAADFNGDGFADIAVAAALESFGGNDEGMVHVFYGSESTLNATDSEVWHRNSPGMGGPQINNDHFGVNLVLGDFDGDGYTDLVIGANDDARGGALNVLYGSRSGLSTSRSQYLHRGTIGIPGDKADGGSFGGRQSSVTSGDFNGDGYDDLAVGNPGEGVGNLNSVGSLTLISGSTNGLQTVSAQKLNQDSTGIKGVVEYGDRFGEKVVAGDFDGDGYVDLAVSAPSESIKGHSIAGVVHLLKGSASGITHLGDRLVHLDTPGIAGDIQGSQLFGRFMTVGDFDGNGFDDLVIGDPFVAAPNPIYPERVGCGPCAAVAGGVHTLYGTSAGLSTWNDDYFRQSDTTVMETADEFDYFGENLSTGDTNGDGYDELIIGIGHEDRVGFDPVPPEFLDLYGENSGAVAIFYGTDSGLLRYGNQLLRQDDLNLSDGSMTADFMGTATAVADVNGDDFEDLIVGASGDRTSGGVRAGAINIIYGSANGPDPVQAQRISQKTYGVYGITEEGDSFGGHLAN